MDTTTLFVMRLMVIGLGTCAFGMAGVAAVEYFHLLKPRKLLIPVDQPHALMVASSYLLMLVSGMLNVLDDIVHRSPFAWYSSPILGLSLFLGLLGMYRLIRFELGVFKKSGEADGLSSNHS